jgi:hypothetical protein
MPSNQSPGKRCEQDHRFCVPPSYYPRATDCKGEGVVEAVEVEPWRRWRWGVEAEAEVRTEVEEVEVVKWERRRDASSRSCWRRNIDLRSWPNSQGLG